MRQKAKQKAHFKRINISFQSSQEHLSDVTRFVVRERTVWLTYSMDMTGPKLLWFHDAQRLVTFFRCLLSSSVKFSSSLKSDCVSCSNNSHWCASQLSRSSWLNFWNSAGCIKTRIKDNLLVFVSHRNTLEREFWKHHHRGNPWKCFVSYRYNT